VVHLNGSGARLLKEQYKKAIEALEAALEAVPVPHGRDYYVIPEGEPGYKEARDQFEEQVRVLRGVKEELLATYRGIVQQERA
jgi:hypothetical protein